jgi:DNA-binding NarL/FixJ family response regulator
MRVVVADDFPAIRRGVAAILESTQEFQVVGEAGTADETLEVLAREEPELAVIDLGMPGVRGLDLLRSMRAAHPDLAVLVFSEHREEEVGLACLKAGANGFLNKSASVDELVDALKTVASGRRYLSSELLETLVEGAPLPDDKPPHHALSDRELDVLCRLARGQRITEIAAELGIHAKTVHTYRTRIFGKLGVRTNVDLVLYAVEHRLLGWPPHDTLRLRPRLER